jgi:hypothetical protein
MPSSLCCLEKDRELADIKSKIAEAMALHMIPTTSACMNGIDTDSVMTSPLYSNKQQREDGIVKSNLNPHASDYSQVSNSFLRQVC